MIAGVATDTIVVSTRIMKKPSTIAHSAGHGLRSTAGVPDVATWSFTVIGISSRDVLRRPPRLPVERHATPAW